MVFVFALYTMISSLDADYIYIYIYIRPLGEGVFILVSPHTKLKKFENDCDNIQLCGRKAQTHTDKLVLCLLTTLE